MDDYQIEKVKQFLRDKVMSTAVRMVLMDTFLQKRDGDVHTKAAQRYAIDFLIESWDNLGKIVNIPITGHEERHQKAL